MLVGVEWAGRPAGEALPDLDELDELAGSAGAVVVGRLTQKRSRPDPAYYIGYGKAKELASQAGTLGADLIIMDEELSPAQVRNLEDATGRKVVDRTGLILDIFAQRARTSEAKLQVELAQLDYILPRLSGLGTDLSRLGGGIGTRGPGETKLEVDRRRIRRRMSELRKEIDEIGRRRSLMRRPRERSRITVVALIGYTNAGKSTLFNVLTGADVAAEDRLFATLDPTLRRLDLPCPQRVVMADTVGFIRKLPTQLVAAFRSTLEEVVQADLLLHVMDAYEPGLDGRCISVQTVLNDLGGGGHPVLNVLNKIDLLDGDELAAVLRRFPAAYAVSARGGTGIDELKRGIGDYFLYKRGFYHLFIPFAASGVIGRVHDLGTIIKEEYGTDGVEIEVELDPVEAERLRKYWLEPVRREAAVHDQAGRGDADRTTS